MARQEVNERLNAVSRPMRGMSRGAAARNEGIAKTFFKQISAAHFKMMARIFKELPTPSLTTVLGNARKSPDEIFQIVKGLYHLGHDCTHHKVGPGLTPAEIRQVTREFETVVGVAANRTIEAAGAEFIETVIGSSAEVEEMLSFTYGQRMRDTIKSAGDDAFRASLSAWERQSRAFREANPFLFDNIRVFAPDSRFIKTIYKDGFERVTGGITKQFMPQIKNEITSGLLSEQSWSDIAVNLNDKFATGGLQHWERLVRSEMANGIDKAHMDAYKQMDVGFVRYVPAPDACPTCIAWRDLGPIYPVADAPDIIGDTHPNCRCVKIPVWNPRKNQSIGGAEGSRDAVAQVPRA